MTGLPFCNHCLLHRTYIHFEYNNHDIEYIGPHIPGYTSKGDRYETYTFLIHMKNGRREYVIIDRDLANSCSLRSPLVFCLEEIGHRIHELNN